MAATQNGDLERLKTMQVHGQDLKVFINEDDAGNSLLHYAVKNQQRDIIDFIILM